MKKALIIEIETVDSCFGLSAKFWKGEAVEMQTDLKHVTNAMAELTRKYGNVLFKVYER